MVIETLSIDKKKKVTSDDFLAKPSSEDEEQVEIPRAEASYKDNSERFRLKKRDFIQYNNIYMHRLQRMRPVLQQQAHNKWNSSKEKVKVVDKILQLEVGHKCIVTGTLYKEMPLKPNVLREYAKDRAILPVPVAKSFKQRDTLILDDETGRVRLLKLAPAGLVTGISIAVKGNVVAGGEFEVEDYTVAGFPLQPELPLECPTNAYVALVSGLNLGDSTENELALVTLQDYLGGFLGSVEEQEFNAHIVRAIFAGNNVGHIRKSSEEVGALLKYQTKKQINEEHEKMAKPVSEMDSFFSQMCSSIPVDIMPGEHDPANMALPQQPFNSCLLPISHHFGSCKWVTNPYEAEIGGRIFLGTSGQPVANAMRYMEVASPLDLMVNTLVWRHIAPTVPDTLAAYPYKDEDPFILDQCPHIRYFVGNQDKFDTRVVNGPDEQTVRLISIPDFSTTKTIVLVDLHTLDAFPLSFDVGSE